MILTRNKEIVLNVLFILFLLLVSACDEQPATTRTTSNTPANTPTPILTPQILPTQTDCPTSGTARAAVMPPLPKGTHQNILYSFPNGTSEQYRTYDTATGAKKDILSLNTSTSQIMNSSLSADGQWVILLLQGKASQSPFQIQLFRLDGQELQTLYCAASLYSVTMSPDQKYLAFSEVDADGQYLYTLNLSTGSLHKALSLPPDSLGVSVYMPFKWVSNTSLYVVKMPTSGVGGRCDFSSCYRWGVSLVHDITMDVSQQQNNLQTILFEGKNERPDWDFDMQGDQQVFFNKLAYKSGDAVVQGPGEIDVQPVAGGSAQPVYKSDIQAIVHFRVATDHTLLFEVANEALLPNASQPASAKDHGLWVVNTDGSNPRHLVTTAPGNVLGWSASYIQNQTPWSIVSHDGTLYAITDIDYQQKQTTLIYGSFDGQKQATIGSASTITLIGWTTA